MGGKRAPVLIVEPDQSVRTVMARIVLAIGHPVETAGDAAGARALMTEHGAALVICDLNLAGESGIGLLRWLERNHPATAVLVAGGAGDPQAAATALASGAYGVVRKPFDKEGLALGVAEALRQRR